MLHLHWMRGRTAPLLYVLVVLAFGGDAAFAQSDPIIQTVRTFSPVLSGTTDVVIDPAAVNLDVTVTFTDVNPDPLGSKRLTSFGFQESAMPPGWTSTSDGFSAIPQPTPPAGGRFSSGWFYVSVPALPFTFTYRLNSLSVLADPFDFSGTTSYSTDGGVAATHYDDTQTVSPFPTIAVYRFVPDGPCLPLNVTSPTVQLTIKAIGDMSATTELGLIEVVPTGWLVIPTSLSGANVPENIQINASGNLEVTYSTVPVFPASFSYQITRPSLEFGTKSFTTFTQFRLGAGDALSGPVRMTNLENDANPPTLIFIGIEPITIECGTKESSIRRFWGVSDIEDGNLDVWSIVFSPSLSEFTTQGSYPLTISVSDRCGNTTSETRTLNVLDDTHAPVVRMNCTDLSINCGINCSSSEMIDCGTIYIDAGATALDTCEGDLTDAITVVSTVPNPATPGNWTVTYTATDSNGNTGRVVRYVYVVDNCAGGEEGEPCVFVAPDPSIHSADQNADNVIELTDVLRVLQFFNLFEFHCDCMTNDGFATCFGDQSCTPHSSDFYRQNWSIDLPELLRIFQIFNIGSYHYCPGVGEDGFCPGTL